MGIIQSMKQAERRITGLYEGNTCVRTETANAVTLTVPARELEIQITYTPFRALVTWRGVYDLEETGRINAILDTICPV